ncbi:unnamed protein product [Discula destructiva]
MLRSSIVGFGLVAAAQAAYVWPSQHDDIDDLMYLQTGYNRHGSLSDQISSCSFGANQPGIQKTAEWIRTAFHDAITHDANTGIGGLDASIQYELARAENMGDALNSTLADLSSDVSTRTSTADLLALSLVMSVERCGDLKVPLRVGRVDATDAGIMGVPEAHTDLETSRKRFETASFSQEEMITLVACGHTVGSVHSVDHPEIVSGPVEASNIAQFDTTAGVFDNAPVTEFLNNSTKNPLVVNTNDTLNSDKRIFGADGLVTLNKLKDAAVFKSQCESLLERMIDLVPAGVTLTDPMEPVEVKPHLEKLELDVNGTILFEGSIRIRTTPGTGRNATDMTVSLSYLDREGTRAAQEIPATRATYQGGYSYGYLTERFQWFEFSATLPATGISAFDVKVVSAANGTTTTFDNAGTGGFPVSSDVFFQERNSCLKYTTVNGVSTGDVTLVAAVHKDVASDTVQVNLAHRRAQPNNFIPKLEVLPYTLEQTSTNGDYIYYTSTFPLDSKSWSTTFDIVAGNSTLEYQATNLLGVGTKVCEAI